MEWFTVVAIVILILLAVALGILLACLLGGQRCTVSIQKREPNLELTRMQQEQQRKKQKKLSTKIKRAFRSSSKPDQPMAPVEDVKTVEFTLQMGNTNANNEEQTSATETSKVVLLPQARVTKAELEERQKKRDAIRKKYNL